MTRRPIPLLLVALLLLSSLAPLASAGEAWTKETGSAITAVATDEMGGRIFVGTESGMLYCYDSAGNVVWSETLAGEVVALEVDGAGDHLLVEIGGDGARVESRNPDTGALVGMYSAGDTPRHITLSQTGISAYTLGTASNWLRICDSAGTSGYHNVIGFTATDLEISGDASWFVGVTGSDLKLYALAYPDWDSWIAPVSGPWTKRISHTITGSTDGALTDYPVEITVIQGTGTSSGNTLYIPDCQPDFRDIRFTAADGVTQLPYYLESVNGNTAKFYVKIPSIPASPATTTIYVYWANHLVTTTTSDPAAVYAVYDDFNDGVISPQWDIIKDPDGIVQETGGYLELKSPPGTTGNNGVDVNSPALTGAAHIEMSVKILSTFDSKNNNRHRFFECSGDPGIFDDLGHNTLQRYWGGYSGDAATLDTFVKHDIYIIPGESTRWIAGSDWDVTSTEYTSSGGRLAFKTGGLGVGYEYGHMQIDYARISKWTPNEPAHGAWGPVESIVTPLDTKTLDGTIIDIDAPETGDWVAVSTTTKTYIIQITDSGFGEIYSADRTGTPYDVAIANNGANTIEGRGILADIFRFDGVQTGTYTAGGPVRTVAIAQANGLYAAAGSDDGKYYIFSKDESSSWYLLHSSDSEAPVTAIAMSWRGEIAVIGRADGSVVLYTTTDAPPPDSQMTVYAIKDGKPYIGKTVSVSTADISDPDEWTPLYTNLRTDSDGKIVISTHTGHYYQININNGEKIVVIQASSATPIHSVVFRSPLIYEKYNYDVRYNASSRAIEMTYTDNEGPATVSWSIVRTDTYSEVYSHTTSGVTAATATYPISEPDVSYKVNVKVQRSSGGSIQNVWFITPQNASPIALPFWDENIQNAVFIIFLMILGGIFYYTTGAKGALIVALVAALFRYFDWITVPWFWIIAAAVFAFLANIAEGA